MLRLMLLESAISVQTTNNSHYSPCTMTFYRQYTLCRQYRSRSVRADTLTGIFCKLSHYQFLPLEKTRFQRPKHYCVTCRHRGKDDSEKRLDLAENERGSFLYNFRYYGNIYGTQYANDPTQIHQMAAIMSYNISSSIIQFIHRIRIQEQI